MTTLLAAFQFDAQAHATVPEIHPVVLLIAVALLIFVIAAHWATFVKAGKPGWAALVPIYNVIVMLQIAGKPIWWFLLLLIPLVNLFFGIALIVDFARSFGKGVGFALGLMLLPIVFYPILGFGSAKYLGPPFAPQQTV